MLSKRWGTNVVYWHKYMKHVFFSGFFFGFCFVEKGLLLILECKMYAKQVVILFQDTMTCAFHTTVYIILHYTKCIVQNCFHVGWVAAYCMEGRRMAKYSQMLQHKLYWLDDSFSQWQHILQVWWSALSLQERSKDSSRRTPVVAVTEFIDLLQMSGPNTTTRIVEKKKD